MKKENLEDIIYDLKARMDCLSLAHEAIKAKSDQYNKVIIVLSLVTGAIESTKIKMGWNNNGVALIPIFMSSIIGMISALAKFEDFPTKMETLVQAIALLTNTLNKARNHKELDDDLLIEYHSALQANETSLYPDIRKTYLRSAHKNLLSIMAQEQKYYDSIRMVKAGETIKDGDSVNISRDNLNNGIDNQHVNNQHVNNQHVNNQHVIDEHVIDEHVSEEHVSDEPVSEEPVSEEPVSEGPVSGENVTDDVEPSGNNVTLDVTDTLERGENKS